MKSYKTPPQAWIAVLNVAGVKDAEVARRLGVSRMCISRWRLGTRAPDQEAYDALVALALRPETLWPLTHRTAGHEQPLRPDDSTALYVNAAPDYRATMTRAFQVQLHALGTLTAGDPAQWEYETIKACAQELDGMARALAIIAADREEKCSCPATSTTVDGVK